MSAAPIDNLQSQALEQRERLHKTALELISKVDQAKQQLSATHLVQRHFAPTSLVGAGLAFILGYAFTGLFTRR
jgi:hypothetical protein